MFVGADTFKVKISPLNKEEHIRIHVPPPLDRQDGSFLVRYRLYGTVPGGLRVEVHHRGVHVAESPYSLHGLLCFIPFLCKITFHQCLCLVSCPSSLFCSVFTKSADFRTQVPSITSTATVRKGTLRSGRAPCVVLPRSLKSWTTSSPFQPLTCSVSDRKCPVASPTEAGSFTTPSSTTGCIGAVWGNTQTSRCSPTKCCSR